jgi:hypothetical protein
MTKENGGIAYKAKVMANGRRGILRDGLKKEGLRLINAKSN